MKHSESIIKALLGRGEREVTMQSASKFRKFTRTWMGMRDSTGALRPVNPAHIVTGSFWFVSTLNGSLRAGATSTTSRKVKQEVKDALMREGTALEMSERSQRLKP